MAAPDWGDGSSRPARSARRRPVPWWSCGPA